jgi:hypothetical protein
MARLRNVFTILIVLIHLCGWTQKTPSVPAPSDPKSQKKKFNLSERLVYGGNFSLNVGTVTLIQVAPQIGLKLKENWTAGVGGNFIYFQQTGYRANVIKGASLWSRYFVSDNLFLYTEGENINREIYDPRKGYYNRNIPVWFVGGGYYNGSRDGFGMSVMLLYDLIDNIYSPYINPVIRVSGLFGF